MANPATVLVVIPAYNEAASLEGVIRGVRAAAPGAAVAVINDGSADATGEIGERLGAIVLHLSHNVGIGAAEQTGLQYALRFGYDVVVRTDGDGQHEPTDVPRLVEALCATGADVVIGSRYLAPGGYRTSRLRRLGSTLLTGAVRAACGAWITDPTSGFRAFGPRAVRLCARLHPFDYPEPESVVLLVRAGLHVRELPVTMHPRRGGRSSISPVRGVYYMIKVLLAIGVGALRRVPRWPPERG
jgi:glycosyltransferase involved in cell wall biosynthesis